MSARPILSVFLLLFCLFSLSQTIVDRTYFRYLGLPITASTQEIQSAYQFKLEKINSESNEQQKAKKLPLLEAAFKTLSNTQQREKYERYGKDYAKHGIREITSLNPYTQHDSRKGATINLKLAVSIQDLYNGTTVKALFQTRQACEKCMGTGAQTSKSLNTCGVCGGKGFSMVEGRNMYGQPQKFEGICPHCQGSGKQVTKKCPICHGNKIHDVLKVIDVKIPPKFQGKELKLKNYGPEQQLGAPSDFLIKIQEIASTHWRRNGDQLFYTMEISFQESIFGFRKTFTHLSGQEIIVERSDITTKETKVVLAGKGFSANGRLTVEFKINIPNFTDRQLDMWEEFFQKYKL